MYENQQSCVCFLVRYATTFRQSEDDFSSGLHVDLELGWTPQGEGEGSLTTLDANSSYLCKILCPQGNHGIKYCGYMVRIVKVVPKQDFKEADYITPQIFGLVEGVRAKMLVIPYSISNVN